MNTKSLSFARDLWKRLTPLRFLIVGGWNFVFSYASFAALYWILNDCMQAWMIVGISSILAITNSYICHRIFTFRSHGNWIGEYIRFYIVYGGQVVITALAIHVLVTIMQYNAYIVSLALNFLLTIATYWAHRLYSFKLTSTACTEC